MQVKQHKLQAIMLHYFSVVLRETVIGQSSNIWRQYCVFA